MPTAEQYLRPNVIAQVGRLDLRAKFIVEGFLSGLHSSPFQGFSGEFSEHRKYTPGDDPQYSDAALGETTGSEEPVTEAGIDPAAGDAADATTDGGAERPDGAEPDLKDAPAGALAVDRESAR